MSETETPTLTAARTPTVYFIDDSATMREVIKIAFRKENIHVVACSDAASAMARFDEAAPDAVITDVIMPDKDGYEVCQFVKQHERFGKTPVILMSGVVNRTVAEKAMAVKADELVRKPFQPHDLIARVKNLLYPNAPGSAVRAESEPASAPGQALSSLFAGPPAPPAPSSAVHASNPAAALHRPFAPAAPPPAPAQRVVAPAPAEMQKLKSEIRRLELLVKKLHAELEASHQYTAALEAHIKALQESE